VTAVEVAEQADLRAEDLGEEERDLVVGRILPGQQPSEALALVIGVRPVLDQPAVPEDRIVEARRQSQPFRPDASCQVFQQA